VFLRKLLKCDQCGRQCFRDHPFVVAGDSLPWHSDRPFAPDLRCEATRLPTSRPSLCERGHGKDIETNTASSRPKPAPLPLYAAASSNPGRFRPPAEEGFCGEALSSRNCGNLLQRRQQVIEKQLRILAHRKMAEALHDGDVVRTTAW